ncbi:MAG TPA: M15 family metallopeptidase [Patescibacteria group bacterium]|nr:M15 family metallopeptidase [Patescibacteria group bacterium]
MIQLALIGLVIGLILFTVMPFSEIVREETQIVRAQPAETAGKDTLTAAEVPKQEELIAEEPIVKEEVLLVNKHHRLASDYEPADLVEIYGITLRQAAADALTAMLDGARSEGIGGLVPYSGYRSYSLQAIVYSNKVARLRDQYGDEAEAAAQSLVAPPGASEHQTGLALDFTIQDFLDYEYVLNYDFADTVQGRWLKDNSWRYGYILRYQEAKEAITMIADEPWHFRYVGKEHAKKLFEGNLCLEEYHERGWL